MPVAWYGPGESGSVPFEPTRPLVDVISQIKPRLVLINMLKRVRHWLNPAEVGALGVPTALIEVDYSLNVL